MVRHALGYHGCIDDVGRSELFQEIFCGWAEGLSEINKAVEPFNKISRHGGTVFHLARIESASRIHVERSPPADLVPQ